MFVKPYHQTMLDGSDLFNAEDKGSARRKFKND